MRRRQLTSDADPVDDGDDRTRRSGDGLDEAHRRYGGLDVPATVAGMLAALGTAVLLGGLLAAAGSFGYQQGVGDRTLSIGGLVAGMATLLVAFLVGGWVAGRIARYDGGRNGLATAVWFVLLAGIAAALGAWAGSEYDVVSRVDLPQWFSDDATSGEAIVTGVVAVVVMLVAGFVGGKLGARYHRRADALIAATSGGVVGRGRSTVESSRTERVVER